MGIIYPKGTFRGIYFSEELKLALKQGYKILEVYSAYEYKESSVIFKDYVDELYEKRLKAVYKKMLNTLYGRFGLVYDKIEQPPSEAKDDINNDEYVQDTTDDFIKKTGKHIITIEE